MPLPASTKVSKNTRRASSPPLVSSNSSDRTPKYRAIRRVGARYSGYIASCLVVSFASARRTAGEQPEVFSLKSRRILSDRPSAGASYVRRFRIALRTGRFTFIGGPSRCCGVPTNLRILPEFPGQRRDLPTRALEQSQRGFLPASGSWL